jgi:hypothetical protein
VKLTAQLHLVLRLKVCGVLPPFPRFLGGIVLKKRDRFIFALLTSHLVRSVSKTEICVLVVRDVILKVTPAEQKTKTKEKRSRHFLPM